MRMRIDWTISALGHAALLAWSLVTFSAKPFASPPEGMPVDIVSAKELSQAMAGVKTAPKAKKPKQLVEKVAEKKPVEDTKPKVSKKPEIKEAKAEPPPAPVPERRPPTPVKEAKAEPKADPQPEVKHEAKAEPKHEAKPEPKPKPKTEPKPEPKHEAKAEPKPEPKPEPKKRTEPKADPIAAALKKDLQKRQREAREMQRKEREERRKEREKPHFDPSKIAALLDKHEPQRHEATGSALNQTASLGLPNATAMHLSQSELDALRRRISQCWTVPAGAEDAKKLRVVLHLVLNRDGTVARPPEVIEGTTSPYGPAFAESGRRAILQCQPYTMLRPESYNDWHDIEVGFDASDMFGG